MEGITQIGVKPEGQPDASPTGLRSILRADPDIIMVGEIRDAETARIAVESALTGHLVLSTLHTKDAPSADRPPDRDGHRAVPHRFGGRLRRRPAARAQTLHLLQEARGRQRRSRCAGPASAPTSTSRPTSPAAASAATSRVTAAARASTRSWTSPTRSAALTVERASGDRIRVDRHRPGNAHDARGRPRQGPDGRHLDRRSRPSHVIAQSLPIGELMNLETHMPDSATTAETSLRGRRRAQEVRLRRRPLDVVSMNASDLHLTTGAPPMIREHGKLRRSTTRSWTRSSCGRPSTRSSPTISASGWRPSGRSTSRTRSPGSRASVSTLTSSAIPSAPPSA